MEAIREGVTECARSVATNPLMAFMLIIFLVQAYIQIAQLDKINETLAGIREDNVVIREYIYEEKESTKDYTAQLSDMKDKLSTVLERIK